MALKNNKIKLAIFDLTDCEGCELQIINLKEKLLTLSDKVEISNWRMAQNKNQKESFDISLIEGSVITKHEIDLIKKLRKKSKIIIAFGSCASIGGIPSIIGEKNERKKLFSKIYSKKYKPKGLEAKPIDNYIKVDYYLNGCPVSISEIERILTSFLIGKLPKAVTYPVCLECKFSENNCLLVNDKICLGPIIQGGCGAICIQEGKYCYGCQGLIKDANIKALKKRLKDFLPEKEIKNYLSMFLKNTKEFKNIYK